MTPAFRPRDERGIAALRWWHDRCVEWCYQRFEDGKFGDQKYLDDWPDRFAGVHVVDHPGVGLAPWNVSRHELVLNGNGVPGIGEAVAEKLELKREIFQRLDAICPPDVILATNTSVISITEIAERARNKERIVGTHFWNPPYLVPLVEVVRGMHTSPQTVDGAYDLLKCVGKHPVRVMKDVPGFVGNRLQHALWREAISIVENGVADAATVDEVVKSGFGLRLPVLGPLENADLVGLDLTFQIHDYILKYLERSTQPSPLLKQKVEAGELGFKSGVGFQEWSEERISKTRENLLNHLLKIAR